MKSDAGVGSFLNPGKLLTKDKKSSGILPASQRATAETSVRNQPQEEEPNRSVATKKSKYSMIYADSSEDQSISSKPRAKKVDDYEGVEPSAPPAQPSRSRNDYYEDDKPQPARTNKYSMKYNEEEEDDIRPRPRRNSQRSNSDEQNNSSRGKKTAKDPRGQARARIRDLLSELQTQQQTVKRISEEYNRKLRKTIDEQFNKFREAIRLTVDEIMARFEQDFKAAYEREEEATIQGIAQANDRLVELQGRLEQMEDQVDRSNWRNALRSLDSEELKIELEDAFVLPKDQLSGLQLKIDEQLLDEFGQALERLMKVQVVRKKQSSRRKPNI